MIEWLLDRGADPNGVYGGVDHCGHSLRLYVQMSDIDKPTKAARMLIERGADVNASKALHMAAMKGMTEWVRMLVEEDHADVDADDIDVEDAFARHEEMGVGKALHYAAQNGDIAMATFLVRRGADLNCRDSNGWTAEQVAEWLGKDEVRAFLQQCQEKQELEV
ncbi:ankyrin repeat-containing protein 36 [Elsinoe australis]|uniref:Ankyrin repeat-containing protein 36 n=1 Tax=Elsinoe australis TaxID=40998 RepID=A0A4U7APZ1_9PEZI|nr:ankyrin repeat-containing protein 36 [Elsinoe australis]